MTTDFDAELMQMTNATRNKGIATRSKKLLVAPGHTTSNKKLLVTRAFGTNCSTPRPAVLAVTGPMVVEPGHLHG